MKGLGTTERIFAENLRSVELIAQRLSLSVEKLARLFPISPDRIDQLDVDTQESLDAFVKRFEQLQDTVESKLFRGIALLEQEDMAAMSKRDLTILMEKLGAVQSADEWSMLSILRNKLAHEYPYDPETQSSRLNEAHKSASLLINSVASLKKFVRSKNLVPATK